MRILKLHPLLKIVTNFLVDAPQPSNLSYWWNVGSLLGLSLVIQIITGITLAMHYNASVVEAFNSVEHIMRDVNSGWFIRYLHSNTASAFFFLVYLHIGKGLYYGSYKAPRTLVWTIGTVIFILMMATAFLGYVLPYGQMSLWGATVITNLMSAIPWIGQDIVEFVWGGFSVNNATLNRFFSLHFVLPFILAALVMMHLISLHDSAGSSNPVGSSANYDRLAFAPFFIFKDIITIFIFAAALVLFVFFLPNVLGDSENYVMANPMQTPPAIVPEWYLLPFYAILRSVPSKLVGVIAMFTAILIILALTLTDLGKLRGLQFKPVNKNVVFQFVCLVLLLTIVGSMHVESPLIEVGQVSTLVYFAYFLVAVVVSNLIELAVGDLSVDGNNKLAALQSFFGVGKGYISKPYSFVNTSLQSMPIPAVKCPNCGSKGNTVWVIPGKNCPQCGTPCGKMIASIKPLMITTMTVAMIIVTAAVMVTVTTIATHAFDNEILLTLGLGLTLPSKPHLFINRNLLSSPLPPGLDLADYCEQITESSDYPGFLDEKHMELSDKVMNPSENASNIEHRKNINDLKDHLEQYKDKIPSEHFEAFTKRDKQNIDQSFAEIRGHKEEQVAESSGSDKTITELEQDTSKRKAETESTESSSKKIREYEDQPEGAGYDMDDGGDIF